MAAFDVTTKPTGLSLKPGSTGTIIVVVSNRLGRPIMGLVEGVMTPASASKWLVSPPDLQRRYEADPAATVNYEFKVAVPKDALAQAAQFKASVRDVLAPDDTRVEGQTVAINVTREPVPPPPPPKRWWIWLIVAAVVLGGGVVLWLIFRPKGVPDVRGKTVPEATATLKKAGFSPVTPKDTVGGASKDTNRVVRQDPKPKSELPVDSMKGKTPATIVVNRRAAVVPDIVGDSLIGAVIKLDSAGLHVGQSSATTTRAQADDNKIFSVTPAAGTKVPWGSAVQLVYYAFSTDQPPGTNPCIRFPEICKMRTDILKRPVLERVPLQ
jgi:hypothetical protein